MLAENFKHILSLTDWNDVLVKTITNESYDQFIKKFSLIYDEFFPVKVIAIKTKNLLSPWIAKGVKGHPRESKNSTKIFGKRNPQKMNNNTKIISTYLKRLKKKYFQEKLNF